jgi:SagB-type dehydrogenase family enzyme
MTEAAPLYSGTAGVVRAYHARTMHRPDRYAPGPETLDWTQQPNPFREFSGSPRLQLPLPGHQLGPSFADLYDMRGARRHPLTLESVASLLELSLALSAWKEQGPDRWAVRCTPSSGNLHPTEAYVLGRGVRGLADGVYHYVSRDHALERRCRLQWPQESGKFRGLWIGLSSVHWREAWKYGERAFRYCQLDIGHAIGALRYGAAALGWSVRVVSRCDGAGIASVLGLDRAEDFGGAEREDPDVLLAVIRDPAPARSRQDATHRFPAYVASEWRGRANVLDPHPMYRWPVIEQVAAASAAMAGPGSAAAESSHWPYPYRSPQGTQQAAEIIRHRRSAQRFDSKYTMDSGSFFHLLDSLLPRPGLPWDIWNYAARIHPLIFVHRVEGLAPGLYVLPRRPHVERVLRSALDKNFLWRRVVTAPSHMAVQQLSLGDLRHTARLLNCHQALASDACISFMMLAEFESPITENPWRYRQLHWEAGLLGHCLYLEAEVLGLRGTGIGCFFDDAVHEALGLRDTRFQTLYHFTVGRPVADLRITTLPPYADRITLQAGSSDDGG